MKDLQTIESERVKKSLQVSLLDGIYATVMVGFTMNYTTPFALLLGAKNFHIAMLNSIPQLFSSFAQLKSADMVEHVKSRVKLITVFAFLQSVCWIIMFLLCVVPENFRVEIFILLTTLNTIFGAITNPPWASLMSDTVEKDKYGKYFSWRGKVLGIINLASNFFAGFLLFLIRNKFLGFIIIFTIAGLCRLVSSIYLSKMIDIPLKYKEEAKFSYYKFIKRVMESNFVRFVFFVSLMNFAVFISAPFFSVYMLKEIKLSYAMYTIITTSAALSGLLLLPFWGRVADKWGNAKVVKISSVLMGFLPILWTFSTNWIYLIFINAFAGYVWAGFGLSVGNFIFDAASSEVRTRCIGYYNFTNGIFIFLGTVCSGWLATHLPGLVFGSTLLTMFVISGVMRFLVVIFLVRSFSEVKKVPYIRNREMLFNVLGIRYILDFGGQILYPLKDKKTE